MILAAVLLVIGLIALAGMVARVNQLGSQTAVESNKAILGELSPLSAALDSGVQTLALKRDVLTVGRTVGSVTLAGPGTNGFVAADVGSAVTGTGIPAGATIVAVTAGSATISAAALTTGSGTVAVGPFALSDTTSPTLEQGIIAYVEHLQRLEATRGFVMDYEIRCSTAGNLATGQVVVHLSDGTVWVEVRSTTAFTRSSCATVIG